MQVQTAPEIAAKHCQRCPGHVAMQVVDIRPNKMVAKRSW